MKYLLICMLSVLCGSLNAQGNLQFNQVITYNIGGIANNYDNINFTVPVGKVWKIESAVNWTGNPLMLYPNGVMSYGITLASSSKTVSDFPIWLNAGYNGLFSIYQNRALISIIEFNIVP
jgi:hypothetical protein